MTMTDYISAKNLSKSFGKFKALSDVSISIQKGQIVGLIGANGAGKTTLINAILGLSSIEGDLSVLGLDPYKERDELMKEVCFISDVATLPEWIKVEQAMQFVEGVHPKFDREKALKFLGQTSIPLDKKVGKLSKGMIVQLHLALIMAIDAKLLVLDEPTLGLDIMYRKKFFEQLLEDYFDEERTIIITTHQVDEIENILTDVIFIREGRIMLITKNEIIFNDMSMNDEILSHLSDLNEGDGEATNAITGILLYSPSLLWITAGFCMFFTALSSLHDERKDSSILFWKSMPVSDTQEVLVKLATVVLVIPLAVVPFAFIIQTFILIVLSIFTLGTEFSVWSTIFSNVNIFALIIGNIVPKLITVLWILPLITWFMLVSSFSRRPPFLVAFATPAIIIATEQIFFEGSLLLKAIATLFENMGENYGFGSYFSTTSFLEPSLWVGLVASVLMIVGCIEVRKRNSFA
jgi:ABC-2 type transport system ATP-binding protein